MATDPKKPKEPKLPPELEGADGPIPWDHWDNDQRFTDDADKPDPHYDELFGPGTGYDKLVPKK
jgi:hypothetical protein